MEGMSSSCQVPTQLMGLDTCMCSCGTPCFALTQVPVSPKEASLLAPAPSGCVPLRGSSGCVPLGSRGAPCSAPWGPARRQMDPRTSHPTRPLCQEGLETPSPLVWGHQQTIWGPPCRVRAGCQLQRPWVWQGLGRAGHAGQSPGPAAQPCQGALRKEHVFTTAGFPLAAPPAHSLPRAPLRGRPAPRTPRLLGPADL